MVVNPEVPLLVGVDEYPVDRWCVTWVVVVGGLRPDTNFHHLLRVLVPS